MTGTLMRVVPPIDLAYLSTDAGEVYSFRLSMLALAKPLKNLGIGLLFWLENGVVVDYEPNYAYYNDDCWKRSWEDGIYCQRSSGLPASIRDESQFNNPYRDWWEADGYDRGYARDGAPSAQPPPQRPVPVKPPRRSLWRRGG